MLHQFTFWLFQLKLIQPTEHAIMYWISNYDTSKLEYALKHGNYRTRQWSAEGLEHIGSHSSIPILLTAMNDKIHNVSIAALNALETIGCTNEIVISVISKRFNWVKEIRDKTAKQNVKKAKKHNIYRWERSSKKSFDRVKEQLKRPIR